MSWFIGWRKRLPGGFWIGWRRRLFSSGRRRAGIGCGTFLLLACCAAVCLTILAPSSFRVNLTPTRPTAAEATATRADEPAPTATVVEKIVTLTPRPTVTATKISITNTALLPSPTQVRITFTPAAVIAPTDTSPAVVLPTDTPVILVPTETQPAPAGGTNYDHNGDGKVTCADFSTQAEAQAAYNAGYTNLDGNDNDGKACESLP